MTISVVNTIPRKFAETAQTAQYTSPDNLTIIDKMTATNISANDVTFSVWLVANLASIGNSNLVLKARTIAPNETYQCPEIIGQVLLSGGYIATQAGSANAIVISGSGRVVSDS